MRDPETAPGHTSRVQGWWPLYVLSWRLGLRALLRRRHLREAVIRIVVPLDPSRYLELPHALRELRARPGERVLDLASPKLAAVALARSGVEVVSVDRLESEVAAWREMTDNEPGVSFVQGDGRALGFPDESFDHAYSISVLEHIPEDGDESALRELVRVMRPGGRLVLTTPYADSFWEDWRDQPVYGGSGAAPGRHFFERWYDDARLDRLLAAAPQLRTLHRSVVSLRPNLHRVYARLFPWLVPLGPFFGLAACERAGPPGDVVRVTLVKDGDGG